MRKSFLFCFAAFLLIMAGFAPLNNAQGKDKPRYGDVLRVIYPNGPQMLSYIPMMGPGDSTLVFPAGERLIDTIAERSKGTGYEPVLAEKVIEDIKGLKITWHIRKGVKFHDGTVLDAENVRWNFQQILDAKALPYSKFLKSMKVVNKYTLVMYLTEYSNQLVPSWGWWPAITSKAAWMKASGGDLEKGKEWARTHIVGTGPFLLKEYKRDSHMTWVKNPNYWRKGRPYLDGIEVRFVPDTTTAAMMMKAKEVDVWNGASPRYQAELQKEGFKKQSSWAALSYCIWINTANPDSKWQDKRVREALEYALDKDSIAKALGSGQYVPLKSLPPEGEWGYDPDYNPRPYNPEKAKQLLAEAGYKNGFPPAKLLVFITPDARDAGAAIKQYLDAAGFNIEIDVADPGRFFGTIYNTPPGPDNDLAWWICGGRDPNYLLTYMRWFSTQPFTNLSYLKHLPGQAELDTKAQELTDLKKQAAITKEVTHIITDNAMVIPVLDVPGAAMQQPWVHSTQYEQGFARWQTEEVWMEKH